LGRAEFPSDPRDLRKVWGSQSLMIQTVVRATASVAAALKKRARIAIGTDKGRRIQDPAFDQLLQPPLGLVIKHRRSSQSMQVAVGIEPELRWAVVPVSKALERIAEGLELPDGVWMLQRGHDMGKPFLPFCYLKGVVARLSISASKRGDALKGIA
jgi:hypothetical protein